MGQKDDVRSILELQDEIVQRRAVWDSAPWLELNMSTPQLKALVLISDEGAVRMRELGRKLGRAGVHGAGVRHAHAAFECLACDLRRGGDPDARARAQAGRVVLQRHGAGGSP